MIKGVIFDMDGLMFDTERLSTSGWLHAGKQHGYEISREFLDDTRGQARDRTRKLLVDQFGEDFDYEMLTDMSRSYMDEIIEKEGVPIKEGLFELLDTLDQNGYRKAVATSTERHRVDRLLEEAGVGSRFDAVICGDEVELGKPDPDIFIKAAGRIGLLPQECFVLEDSPYGILAAWKCGAKPILIPDRTEPPLFIDSILYSRKKTLLEVIPIIEGLGRGVSL